MFAFVRSFVPQDQYGSYYMCVCMPFVWVMGRMCFCFYVFLSCLNVPQDEYREWHSLYYICMADGAFGCICVYACIISVVNVGYIYYVFVWILVPHDECGCC